MPIICGVCGAANEHLTAHCPNRQDSRSCDRQGPQEGKGGIFKGHGKRGGDTAGGRGRGVGQNAMPRQEVYQEIVSEATASDDKPGIGHKCSDGEAATRRFMRIRPSAVDWATFGWVYAKGSQERAGGGEKNVQQLRADWKELSSRRDLSRTDLADGLKQLALRHGVQAGKWLFFLKPALMDRVWPALVWALSKAALGKCDSMKVGGGAEYVCCVFMRNCFDPEEVESLRSSLHDLLVGLVARVELLLKPDAYSYCGIYRSNPWKLSTSLASCKVQAARGESVQAAPVLRDDSHHDRCQLAPLLQAVEEESVEVLLPILEAADSRVALLDSLHAIALHPSAGDLPLVRMCAMLKEAKSFRYLLARILKMMAGLVETDAAFIFGRRSLVFSYPEFKRMHMANFGLLADLCVHGLMTGTRSVTYLPEEMERCLIIDSFRLPPPSTWAFVLQNLGDMAQRLADSHPNVSRSLDSFVQDGKVSSHSRLSILSLNVCSDAKQRELRTAALLSALQQLGPVVCCLQEVTPKVAKDLQRALPTWDSSDPGDGSSTKGHGVLMLGFCLQKLRPKLLRKLQALRMNFGSCRCFFQPRIMAPPELDVRFSSCLLQSKDCKLLVAEFPGLAVGNVHLSSSPELRERQLADCAKVMQQWSNMLLVGDFSMDEDVLHRCVLQNQLPDFTDLWPTLRKEKEHSKGKGKGTKRTGRALAKLPWWQPVDMQLMFDQPLLPGPFLLDVLPSMYSNFVHLKPEVDTDATFVSDHLGLLTTIEQNADVSRSQDG